MPVYCGKINCPYHGMVLADLQWAGRTRLMKKYQTWEEKHLIKEKEVWLCRRKTELQQAMRWLSWVNSPLAGYFALLPGSRPHYLSQAAVNSCELGYKWLWTEVALRTARDQDVLGGRHAYLGTFTLPSGNLDHCACLFSGSSPSWSCAHHVAHTDL